jgi:hypothetical protein
LGFLEIRAKVGEGEVGEFAGGGTVGKEGG